VRGKQFKQSLRRQDLPEARRKLRDYRATVEGAKPSSGKVTVKSVCETFRSTFQDQSESTRQDKGIMLANFEDESGGFLLRNVNKSEVPGFDSRVGNSVIIS